MAAQGAIMDVIDQLPAMAEAIHRFRARRNEIIHEVATVIGRHEKEFLTNKSWTIPINNDITFSDLHNTATVYGISQDQRICKTISWLREWYFLLAKVSNVTFIIENKLRRERKDDEIPT